MAKILYFTYYISFSLQFTHISYTFCISHTLCWFTLHDFCNVIDTQNCGTSHYRLLLTFSLSFLLFIYLSWFWDDCVILSQSVQYVFTFFFFFFFFVLCMYVLYTFTRCVFSAQISLILYYVLFLSL